MAKRGIAKSTPIDRGTPETRRHKRRSTMERLIETGRIGGYELRAAQEIEKVFYFIAGGLLSRTMRYEERTDPSSSNDVPEWFLSAYHKRYKPFADDPKSGFQICIEVLVDGRSGRTIDNERRWPRGTDSGPFWSGHFDRIHWRLGGPTARQRSYGERNRQLILRTSC